MNEKNKIRSTRVLVVEDNPIDVRLIRYALEQERNWTTDMIVAEDGEKAISLLNEGASPRGRSGRPDFVILDLNLPKRDGTEVLQAIRHNQELRHLPVAILSSSPTDIVRGKIMDANVHANWYFTKPMDADSFIALGKTLHDCYRSNRAAQCETERLM